ncbi:replication protein P [Pseudomonas schmalbachii]|uniref:Uncharacterized protein n=1 Tax=Pseudomonas schmalbachii TaxID=2816993 RepID=A0ABS3TKH5_9PSED|nr:replication protein P [Pseudomonas schmalbachii]MBO3274146.1 hypothetical protein [Pseudomonas schmalbachii]
MKQIFTTIRITWPAWYAKYYAEPEASVLAKRIWLTAVRALSDAQIDRGLQRMVQVSKYPPNPAEFIELCRHIDGVPTAAGAWYEALASRYSHPAVRAAAKLTGLFDLQRAETFDTGLRARFEHHYAVVLHRLEQGEPLDGPVLQAIGNDAMRSQQQLQDEQGERWLRRVMEVQGLSDVTGVTAREQLLAALRIRRDETKGAPHE